MSAKKPVPKRNSPSVAVEAAINNHPSNQVISKSESFEGPLPHPDILKKYDDLFPGAGKRIFAMAESEQSTRHEAIRVDCQNKATLVQIAKDESEGALRAQLIGQVIGCIISLSCVGCALYSVIYDKPLAAVLGFLAIPTASFIGSFMPKLWRKEKEPMNQVKQ